MTFPKYRLAPRSLALALSLALAAASTTSLAKPSKPAAPSSAAAVAPSAPPVPAASAAPSAAARATPPARTASPPAPAPSSASTSSASSGTGGVGMMLLLLLLAVVAGIGALFAKLRGRSGAEAPTGESVEIKTTVIERQPADSATFPVGDSVLKGTVVVTARAPCVLASTRYEVHLELDTPSGPVDELVAKDQTPREASAFSASFGGTNIEFPLRMSRGKSATQTWLVKDIDLAATLAAHGFADPSAAASDPRVRLVVACFADVKDASAAAATRTVVRMTS